MWDYVSDFDIFCWRLKNMLYFLGNRPWKRLSKNLLGIKRGFSKAYKYFLNIRKNKSTSLNLKFFLKSTRPSLPLKKAPPLFPSPFPLRVQGMYKPPYSVLKPLRYKVGGPSEVYASSGAAFFVRDKPQGHGDCCWWERRDTMLDAVMIILFIRLWTGSTLERFPSGLWQKSYDLHWHLMNDISAYVLYKITQNANLNELILLRYCSYQTKSKVYHSLYGIPYSSSSCLSKNEDYILPVSDCLLPKA